MINPFSSPHRLFIATLLLLCGCSGANQDKTPPVMTALDTMEGIRKDAMARREEDVEAAMKEAKAASDAEEAAVQKEGKFKAKFETSAGDFIVEVNREWAPRGAQRFYDLVSAGFYDECRFFRVVPNFMVQFGINGDPAIQGRWEREIPDDPVKKSNKRGFVTFAKTGRPNSRTTQIFINFVDNTNLDSDGFSPFGEVVDGMQNVDAIYSAYGERPDQGEITFQGNAYLSKSFPNLDYVKKATIIEN